jgi:hypothetical protein
MAHSYHSPAQLRARNEGQLRDATLAGNAGIDPLT